MNRCKNPALNTLRTALAAGALVLMAAPPVSALTIEWDYTYDTWANGGAGFFQSGSAERNALERAGQWFETAISDNLLPVTSPDPGSLQTFTARFSNPSAYFDPGDFSNPNLGVVQITEFEVPADTVRIYAGSIDLDRFSTSTLAVAYRGLGGPSFFAPQSYKDQVLARGQGPSGVETDTENQTGPSAPTATDIGIWGGWISFDSGDRAWHTDLNSLPGGGTSDLFSVALHELGHVFGVGTTDSYMNLVSGTQFTGANAVAEYGGNVPLTSDGAHLSNGVFSQVAGGFDAAAGISEGGSQEANFDPSINIGTRKFLTDLDVALLQDTGWEVNPAAASVPLPGGAFLLGPALGLLLLRARRA